MCDIHKKKIISIAGACRGAGATFIATSLAFVMAQYEEGVTYLEGCGHEGRHSLPLYELSLDKRISQRRFADFFAMKEEKKPIDNRVNLYKDVNWVVRRSGGNSLISPEEVAGRYIIWDNPPDLKNSDLIICVIDILPSKVLAGRETVEHCCKNHKNKTIWLFNRADSQRQVKAAEKFLEIKGDFCIGMQPQEDFYRAQNSCSSLMDNDKNLLLPKPLPKLAATFEEVAQHIRVLY